MKLIDSTVKTNWKLLGGIIVLTAFVIIGTALFLGVSLPESNLPYGGERSPLVCKPTYDPVRIGESSSSEKTSRELMPPIDVAIKLRPPLDVGIKSKEKSSMIATFIPREKALHVVGELKTSGVVSIPELPDLSWKDIAPNQEVATQVLISISSLGKGDILWAVKVMDEKGEVLYGTSVKLYLFATEDGVVSNTASEIFLDVQHLNLKCSLGKITQAQYDRTIKKLIEEMSRGRGGITSIQRLQTYRSEEFGFEVSYPDTFTFRGSFAQDTLRLEYSEKEDATSIGSLSVTVKPTDKTNIRELGSLMNSEYTTLGTDEALRLLPDSPPFNWRIYVLIHNNKEYTLHIQGDIKALDQILSTFRFVP